VEKISISNLQARNFILDFQNLSGKKTLEGKSGIIDFFNRVRCVQFDPINVVGFNHDLVLQSRVKAYSNELFNDLLYNDRVLLDGWDKNMSIYKTEDWPYFERNRIRFSNSFPGRSGDLGKIIKKIKEIIESNGPVSSSELKFEEKVDWFWAPTKIGRAALETMFFSGELIIHRKVHTRKYYDFSHRHIPEEIFKACEPNESTEDYFDWYVLRRINSIGLLWNKAGAAWLGIMDISANNRNAAFKGLQKRGLIFEVFVEGIPIPFYISENYRDLFNKSLRCKKKEKRVSILAPLDNLLWDRVLIKKLFDFDYVWEVYKPLHLRQYGYYVLPVLYGNRFIARFQPVNSKKNKTLLIQNWWWEDGIKPSKLIRIKITEALEDFRNYLGAERIEHGPGAVQMGGGV